MRHLKRIFWRGVATLLPVAVTVAILYWIGISLEQVLGGLIRLVLPEEYYVPGTGLVAAIVIVFAIGMVMRAWLVRELMRIGESIIERIPLAKTLYGGVRDILGYLETAADQRGMGTVVAIEVLDGQRILGFLTSETLPFALDDDDEEERVAVFIPMSYQIGGFTVCVSRSRIARVKFSHEDAMRWVLTAGVSAGKKESR